MERRRDDAHIFNASFFWRIAETYDSSLRFPGQKRSTSLDPGRFLAKAIAIFLPTFFFIAANPLDAQSIANKRLEWDSSFLHEQWSEIYFSLSLDRTLIAVMEDQARWMVSAGLAASTEIPDFTRFVNPDALAAEAPNSVGITR